MDETTTIGELKEICRQFIHERDWERDDLKDLTLAMSIEVAEILEHLRFKSDAEIREYLSDPTNYREIGLEVADVFYFLMTICLKMGLDLSSMYKEKMAINEQHYPSHLAKGSNKKWTHYVGASDTEQSA
jgi:dCTP diphosphatase